MQIIEKRLSELLPYENNPRNNDKAVKYVAESIKEFGFKVPIVIDSNNVIVCGHTRYKASEMLGIDEVPCIVADDLTEEQIKAFRLADNKVSEFADWDVEKLNQELKELPQLDLSLFGFSFFEDINDDGIELNNAREDKLTFGNKKVPITSDELQLLNDVYNEYIDSYGVGYGFARWLVENEH